jgi:hypothetical protein
MLSLKTCHNNEKGFILLGMLCLMLLLAVAAVGMNRRAGMGLKMAANQLRGMQIYLGQRAAIEHTKWKLKQDPSWRTSSSGEDYVFNGITYNRKALDAFIPCHGKFIEASAAVLGGMQPITKFLPLITVPSSGMALWCPDNAQGPELSTWDGSSFGTPGSSAEIGKFRIMAGAESPTAGALGEIVVVGVDSSGDINAEIWNGFVWSELPFNILNNNEVSETYWWGCDVAYEQLSGYAVLVYNNNTAGSLLQYAVGNMFMWNSNMTVSVYSGGEPQHMHLAAKPEADEMVLVVNDVNADDYALVWDGSDWGNAVLLDASGTSEGDQTALYVAYEQQSGNAMVVYGKNTHANPYYRIWDGVSWGFEGTIAAPSGVTSEAKWLMLASDPNSNRIVLGVLTSGGDWLSVWDGTSWIEPVLVETTEASTVCPNVAVAFESQSGQALATYGQSGQSVVRYRTWNSCDGWSEERQGPDIGVTPNSMMLDSDPASDHVMLSVQNSNSELYYVLWNGGSWDTPSQQENDTGETKNQPFIFLYDQS